MSVATLLQHGHFIFELLHGFVLLGGLSGLYCFLGTVLSRDLGLRGSGRRCLRLLGLRSGRGFGFLFLDLLFSSPNSGELGQRSIIDGRLVLDSLVLFDVLEAALQCSLRLFVVRLEFSNSE